MEMADLYTVHHVLRRVTLKFMSRSPKSNKLFPLFKPCIYPSLVKISLLVRSIAKGSPILDISKCQCDLENNMVKVTKI